MTKTGNIFFFLAVLFSGVLAFAEGVTVSSAVDRNELGVGDTLTFTVVVNSTEELQIQEPRIPQLDGFELLNKWPSTAISQRLVQTNSGMKFESNYRKEFNYQFATNKKGTLSIGSFEVVIDGAAHRTQPIVIKVGEPGAVARPQKQQDQYDDPFGETDPGEDMFEQLLKQRQRLLQQMPQFDPFNEPQEMGGADRMPHAAYRSLPQNPNDAFFISVELDKTEVFEGEQVTANWYVYTRGQMETLDRLKFPSLKGFWKENIEEVPALQFSQEIVNTVPWKKALIASHALFPIKAGTAVIDEYKIKSRVRTVSQGYGYAGKSFEYTKTSARVPIKVKPLPVEGRPSDFTGAVGTFDVTSSVDNVNVLANQPFSLKVRFDGTGNAKTIDLPGLNLPNGLEQYDTKSDSKFFKNGRSYKEFDVLIIPRQEGELIIPSFSVSMFDPKTSKYYTKTTDPIHLNVEHNPNAPSGSSMRLADSKKQPPKNLENQLPQIIMESQSQAGLQVLREPLVWGASFFAILMGLLLQAKTAFGWGVKQKTLKDKLAKRLKTVESLISKNEYRQVGIEMTNVFYATVGEISGTGGAAIEIQKLVELIPPSLRRQYGDDMTKSFEYFQTLGFAPEELVKEMAENDTLKKKFKEAKVILEGLTK